MLLFCLQPLWQPLLYGVSLPHLELAKTFIGRQELYGNNRGAWVDTWNRFTSAPLGSPYCASFVSWVLYHSAVAEPKISSPLARHFYTKAPKHLKYTAGQVLRGEKKVKAGTIIIWQRGETIYGHVGFALEDWHYDRGKTIEANTSKGTKGSQYDGDGVYIRTRKIEVYNFFRIIGFTEVLYE